MLCTEKLHQFCLLNVVTYLSRRIALIFILLLKKPRLSARQFAFDR